MYESVYTYYRQRIQQTKIDLSLIQKKIYAVGTLRLIVFIATVLPVYFFRPSGAATVIPVILSGIILFLFILIQYNKLQKRKEYMEVSSTCDKNELKALDYNFSAFDGAPEKIDSAHFFSLDLDLFGKHSVFQSVNRTCTSEGKQILIHWFEYPLTRKEIIETRQKAIRELEQKPSFMHHFRVTGLTHPGENSDNQKIEAFVKNPNLITSQKIWKCLGILIPMCWIVLIALTALDILPSQVLIGMYLLTFFISESQAKKVNILQHMTGKQVDILRSYAGLIHTVENEDLQSEELQSLQNVFFKNNEKASVKFEKLSRLANELEQRANLLVHLLLNPLFLWDIRKSIQLEEWKNKHGENLIVWIKTLGQFDAFCSLGIFSFNHPDYHFPTLTDEYFKMEGKNMGHPLMNRDTCINNDIQIGKHPFFLIITGANMAGKSTYLRTVGVNFLLACIGAPVAAHSLTVYPARLITSLRTSDSLNNNESYFFAELKRLKLIIDELKAGEKLFIILDEILKGTNSVDKQNGSLALVRQFIRLHSCGIIATHDLLLGSLEQKFPDNVKNYRFEADIKNDELSFSYKLREGIAQNMNASFLMQKMGITVHT